MSQKVVMISGASKGLGRALALDFAKKGYALVLAARGADQLYQLERELKKEGATTLVMPGDLSKEEDVERFVSLALAEFGRIDVLINNASIFGPGPTLLLDYAQEEMTRVMHMNTMLPFLVTKKVLPAMLENKRGVVITLTSEAGKTGFAEWGAYGISKFAVEGMIETWADELDGTGVQMYLVDPGEMNTDMHAIAVPDCDYPLAEPEERLPIFHYLATGEAPTGTRFEAAAFRDGLNEWGVGL
ncbi:SDR family NAD(P)-dependent oxidoreductase [Shouchella lonarensis]|uniref:Short-chain dehydrogenase n=1 Tax=Shouchella lonarensis TaxID=1464122 RepID=A0A1G6GZJ7_9BACI|nr:SDR family oxidoreductase [Shouchella lonarensis]SDB87381.1 Short-chain dehydrogenase [Shouchella lonarensis]